MTRDALLEACFGRSEFPPPYRIVELQEGRDVVSHLDVYLRRVHLRHRGDFAVEGRGVEASTTLTVATLENLCTDPGRRGRGYAGAMIRRALAELEPNRPLLFAVVRSDDDRLWSRNGFSRPDGTPDGFLVARLRDDYWPSGRVRLLGDWPS